MHTVLKLEELIDESTIIIIPEKTSEFILESKKEFAYTSDCKLVSLRGRSYFLSEVINVFSIMTYNQITYS